MACDALRVCLILGILGLISIGLAGVIGWGVVPAVVRSKIAEILPLRPNSESWDRWKELPVPLQYRIYVFKVNNPDEILKGGMPNVTEVGPYVYKERRTKNIHLIDETASRVVYDQRIFYEFDQEASGDLSEDDELTVAHLPAMFISLIIDSLKDIHPVIHFLNTAITKMLPTSNFNPLFAKVKVRDFLFEGIPILCNHTATLENVDVRIICEAFRIIHPKTTELNVKGKGVHSFAFFRHKNGTSDGIYEIDLGLHDVKEIGAIRSWNNLTSLSHWKGESCNRISGTDMTLFRPYLQQDTVDSLYIYHPDICRSVKLTYASDSEFKGVRGRRYVADDIFESVLNNNDNYCFCPQSIKKITHYGGCLKNGLLELSSCQGAPAVVSFPHFLKSDPLYQDKVVGLNPDPSKHRIFLDLEPNTGYPLRGANRAQLNIYLKSIPEVALMKDLPDVLIPSIWLEETVELPDDLIEMLNSQLLNVLKIVDGVLWGMIGVGISLALGSCVFFIFKIRPRERKFVSHNGAS